MTQRHPRSQMEPLVSSCLARYEHRRLLAETVTDTCVRGSVHTYLLALAPEKVQSPGAHAVSRPWFWGEGLI